MTKKLTEENQYKIRSLTRRDRVVVSKMIEKIADKITGTDVFGLISAAAVNEAKDGVDVAPAADSTQKAKLSIELIKLIVQFANDDITEWFADLLGVSVEDFDKMPFDIEIRVIDQLAEADEVTSFFTGASQLFKEILSSKIQSRIKKTK